MKTDVLQCCIELLGLLRVCEKWADVGCSLIILCLQMSTSATLRAPALKFATTRRARSSAVASVATVLIPSTEASARLSVGPLVALQFVRRVRKCHSFRTFVFSHLEFSVMMQPND